MECTELIDVLGQLAKPRILVLGDVILDRYTWGNAERISQEAPVMVLRADRQEHRLGGAANVCHMLQVLDAQVSCAGVVGDDASGQLVRQLLDELGVDGSALLTDSVRPTTQKERFMGRAAARHPSQILRVDTEVTSALRADVEELLVRRLERTVVDYDAVLVSDYAKGVCTPRVLQALIAQARQAGVPVLVDPARGCDFGRYVGASLIKPNRVEAETFTGTSINQPHDALLVGRQLCERCDLQWAVITLDRDGMALIQRDGKGQLFPISARAVYDITGAGDMVLALLGLCSGAGRQPAHAVQLANVAAGLEVQRHGVATVTRDEIRGQLLATSEPGEVKRLDLRQAAARAEHHRQCGQRVVFTNGCFDLLHVGHIGYLQEAAKLGDLLMVGVNSDSSVRRLKGPTRPVIGQSDRVAMLAALACVDYVVLFDNQTPHELLHAIRPDVLVKGGTYAPHEVVGHEIVAAYGGQVCVTGVTDGISTTRIVQSIAERSDEQPDGGVAVAADDNQGSLRRAG